MILIRILLAVFTGNNINIRMDSIPTPDKLDSFSKIVKWFLVILGKRI